MDNNEFIGQKFPRLCSVQGVGMDRGFVFGDGDFYCILKSDAEQYAQSIGYKNLDEAYDDEAYYYTEWEELDSYWYELKPDPETGRLVWMECSANEESPVK